MTPHNKKILVYGYGNPGRQDDALGVTGSERIEQWAEKNAPGQVYTDSNYQLNLEDAERISGFDIIIFVDASHEEIDSYLFEPLMPSAVSEFSMHSVSPAFILHLCEQIFNTSPNAYLLHIRGYEWEFMDEMTIQAKNNLENAVIFLQGFIAKALNIKST